MQNLKNQKHSSDPKTYKKRTMFLKMQKISFLSQLRNFRTQINFSRVLEKDTNTYKMMGTSYKKLLELHCLGCSVFTDHVGVRLGQEKPINDAFL